MLTFVFIDDSGSSGESFNSLNSHQSHWGLSTSFVLSVLRWERLEWSTPTSIIIVVCYECFISEYLPFKSIQKKKFLFTVKDTLIIAVLP